METPSSLEKSVQEHNATYAPSWTGEIEETDKNSWRYLKHYFTSKEGWIGDYVCPNFADPLFILISSGLCLLDHSQHLAIES